MKVNVVYLISRIDSSQGFIDLFNKLMKDDKINFKVILINPQPSKLYHDLLNNRIPVAEYIYRGKRDILKLTIRMVSDLRRFSPRILHTHLIDAGLVGGLSGVLARVPLRIYTRHHGDMHFFSQKRGRIYDRIIHSCYHKIIALSSGHVEFLRDSEKLGNKLVYIPNFYDPELFAVSAERIEQIKQKYGFNDADINIGVNARWTEWKGVHYTIEAFSSLQKKYSNAKLFLFNASGDYTSEIEKLLGRLPANSYKIVKFERDIMAVYKNFNYFVHVPTRIAAESFGLVYIEAMASGLPCVFTRSGIAFDVVEDGENALIVPFKNSGAINEALEKLIGNKELCEHMTMGSRKIAGMFEINKHVHELYKLYKV